MDTIYNKLIELRKKQEALAFDYEEKASYEMAYLSRWYVLEKILRVIDTECRREQLYHQVCEWKKYLENHRLGPNYPAFQSGIRQHLDTA